jgi:hypothetical protein
MESGRAERMPGKNIQVGPRADIDDESWKFWTCVVVHRSGAEFYKREVGHAILAQYTQ